MRRLIINADDFGLTSGVNRGISECARQGVVTSITMMANAGAFPDAVEQADRLAQAKAASIGCHAVLVDGLPVLPVADVPSLLANDGRQFRASLGKFAQAALTGQLDAQQITAEITAQIDKLQTAGVRLSHLDAHKHVHLFPVVLRPLLQAARDGGIRAIRNPFAPVKPLAFAHLLRRPHLWKTYTEVKILRGWAQGFRRAVAAAGLATTDGTFGIVSTGALDSELFRAIIGCIPEGTWEFCCHPGYDDGDLAKVHTRLRASRDREREVLTSNAARDVLAEHGIELINYWDLGSES
jgi:hopanoid biosynthesis associated protein HpnK